MRYRSLMIIILFFAALPLKASEVCSLMRKSKVPVAYLIDENGNSSTGPVNLGDIPLAADVNDERFKIDTKHLVVVSSRKIYVKNPWAGMGYGVDLIPAKPNICADGLTYKVILNWVRRKGGVRPYQFDAFFPEFSITDKLGYEEEVSNPYKFKPVVIGRMVHPKNEDSHK